MDSLKVEGKQNQPHGADLSTKHIVDDSREPEIEKPQRVLRLVNCGIALRRCDRGTDAMHLANTPVVSPESKNPRWRGSRYIQIVAYHRCHRGAALPSMNGLSKLLGENQL